MNIQWQLKITSSIIVNDYVQYINMKCCEISKEPKESYVESIHYIF